ncbi:MAG: tellurite resistance TerB family protein [Rhodococcus sp. (in: high G+C Gram-positive bacteria)]
MTNQLNPQQALIYAMISMSAVDNKMSNVELGRIGSMARQLPVFATYDENLIVDDGKDCAAVAAAPDGLQRILDLMTASIPDRLRETAYMLCCEVAAIDGRLNEEEIRFLQLLAGALRLDRLTCVALERAAAARYQKA